MPDVGVPMICVIPGKPFAQPAPRAAVVQGRARVYQDPRARTWKVDAQAHFARAMQDYEYDKPMTGPVVLSISAYFPCPKSDYRKGRPRKRRWRDKKPDSTNIVKAVEDAMTGIVFVDDRQVVVTHVKKFTAAQDEAPHMVVSCYLMYDELSKEFGVEP